MTQSGQGNDPHSGPVPVEGVVLPAHGDPWVPSPQPQAHAEQTWEPSSGHTWEGRWAPDQPQPQQQHPQGAPPPPAHAPDLPPQGPGATQGAGYGRMPGEAYPPQGGYPDPAAHGGPPQGGYGGPQPPTQGASAGAMPPMAQTAGQQPGPGDADATQLIPPFDPAASGPAGAPPQFGGPAPMPPAHGAPMPPAGRHPTVADQPAAASPFDPPAGTFGPPPVTSHAGDAEPTQLIPPFGQAGPQPPHAGHPESPGESTTTLRRVRQDGPNGPAGQGGSGSQGGPSGDAAPTQMLPPVPGGAPQPGGAGPMPPSGGPYALRPGAPGERSAPPAEFDGLFRPDTAASGPPGPPPPAGATAPLPRFDGTRQPPPPSYDAPHEPGPGGGARRRLVPLVIVGALVLAGVGVGVGYLTSGSDTKSSSSAGSSSAKAPASSASSSSSSPSATLDPEAQKQAKELDALLADSNNSRSAVVGAVASIGKCQNLDAAAGHLKGAAGQRKNLVNRLNGLAVDKLPDNAALKGALTKAWQASAAADEHYAAWAAQIKQHRHKACQGGQARRTPAYGQAVTSSGQATQAKKQAAGLWNPIADKYGETTRQAGDL